MEELCQYWGCDNNLIKWELLLQLFFKSPFPPQKFCNGLKQGTTQWTVSHPCTCTVLQAGEVIKVALHLSILPWVRKGSCRASLSEMAERENCWTTLFLSSIVASKAILHDKRPTVGYRGRNHTHHFRMNLRSAWNIKEKLDKIQFEIVSSFYREITTTLPRFLIPTPPAVMLNYKILDYLAYIS